MDKFFTNQNPNAQKEYQHYLSLIGSLSNLFSDSKIPYLHYRIAEKVFCKAFSAQDLSRGDVSADAKKKNIGIGLKTFLFGNGQTLQKVAEFNSARRDYENLNPEELVLKIAELRNERIDFTERTYGIKNSIYHCVLRNNAKFSLFEEPMDKINLKQISNVIKKNNSIAFNDGINEYSFMLAKSTLTKRFITRGIVCNFEVVILGDPLAELEKIIKSNDAPTGNKILQTIYLPLYGKNHTVYERSGLNQWNAGGRRRDSDEVYIPIPAFINNNFPDFFPKRDNHFNLILPDDNILVSKVCQDNAKALMSKSNKAIGKWILRKVLKLQEGTLLTYAKLQLIGVDSVRIDKLIDGDYEINFAKIGTYESFKDSVSQKIDDFTQNDSD